jgi:hypothetical protein
MAIIFPPIVESYPPVFVEKIIDGQKAFKIFFEKPSFNSKVGDYIQVAISLAATGVSVIKNTTKILRKKIQTENNLTYVIVGLGPDDLVGNFSLNQYYKVQLRFEDISLNSVSNDKIDSSWYSNNASKFSEWSASSLYRRISEPKVAAEFVYPDLKI